MTLNPTDILNNRYRIIKLLGQGGFGAVYRAWDMNLQKACAVKENLETSPEQSAQFMREATTLANLSHPNLPRVIDHFSIPQSGQYLVMDFVEGENLETKVSNRGPLPYPQAVYWIGQIADALDYLHNQPQPLIHRDVKPANIVITHNGQAMLVDFGLIKIYTAGAKTVKGARGITPGYSPPEQYGVGSTDARSDIYSLGATLYTLLTGLTPAESVELLTGKAQSPVPVHLRNPQVPSEVSETIQEAMQLDANKRYPTAEHFKAALYSAVPTMNWSGMTPRGGMVGVGMQSPPAYQAEANIRPPSSPRLNVAGAAMQASPGEMNVRPPSSPPPTEVNIRPPSSPPPGGNYPTGPASQPARRPSWALFGVVGCAVAAVVLVVVAGIIIWTLIKRNNQVITPALTDTQVSIPTAADTAVPTIPPTVAVEPTMAPTATPVPRPTDTTPPTTPPQLTPIPVFFDDFTNTNSGWPRMSMDYKVTDYLDGFYHIWVRDANMDVWALPGTTYGDVILEVDTYWGAGPFDNDFGVICRYQDADNFYFGAISSDGYAAIFHMQAGSYRVLGTEAMEAYTSIVQGDAMNHIRLDCVGDRLTLFVNGWRLITTNDTTLNSGNVGLIAGTFDEGGVDIYFDNFTVYQP